MHGLGMAGERVQHPAILGINIVDVSHTVRARAIIGWVGAFPVETARVQGCASLVDATAAPPLAVLSSAVQQYADRPNDDRPVRRCCCQHGAIGREANVPYLEEDEA